MKSIKNTILIVIGVIIITTQVVYVVTIQKNIIAEILDLQSQSLLKQAEVTAQEKRLKELPQLQKELEKVNTEKNAVIQSMPTSTSAIREFIEFVKLIESNGFSHVKIEQIDEIPYTNEMGNLLEKKYRLTYTSLYDETKMFIQNLNNSYQLINIYSLSIDNAPQKDKEDKAFSLYYGDEMKKVVASTIEFSMVTRVGAKIEDETYTTTFNLLNNTENAFLNRDSVDAKGAEQEVDQTEEQNSIQPSTEQAQQGNSTFKLELWDVLASGDNYSFVGPGTTDTLYTGLKSSQNTYITLDIREDSYSVVIEDEQGKVKQNGIVMPIHDPSLSIESSIVKIQEKMPNIRIYIKNYTKNIMSVTLEGSLLENIHIYNEFEEEVLKGQTKGKVKLT